MFWKKWSDKPWYAYATAGIIIVFFCAIILNLGTVANGIKVFLGVFKTVAIGAVIAYVMNQLSNFYSAKVFFRIKNEKRRHLTSIFFSVITIVAVITLALVMLIPQLISSITTFANNLKGYESSVKSFIVTWKFLSADATKKVIEFLDSSGGLLEYITNYVIEHLTSVIPALANTGRGIVNGVIAFILAIYFVAGKSIIKNGVKRFILALFGKIKGEGVVVFLRRCDQILARYLVYNILDALIVAGANAAFMIIGKLPYVGLISFIVGVTNLIPTFGPIIGGAIGALLLVIINPLYALAFLIFTVALQTCDGYFIKPKLFGSTLGMPGFLILIAVVVAGRAFGVIGIFLSIPAIAIIDLIYHDYFLPWLERRHQKLQVPVDEQKKKPDDEEDDDDNPNKGLPIF